MSNNVLKKYGDIINLPHHQSKKHPHMSMHDRAAQFSPFAALTGHEQAIKETARLTEEFIELDEGQIYSLNEKLNHLALRISTKPVITVEYFVDDKKKAGGKYVKKTGTLTKICPHNRCIIIDGESIKMEKIKEICTEQVTE